MYRLFPDHSRLNKWRRMCRKEKCLPGRISCKLAIQHHSLQLSCLKAKQTGKQTSSKRSKKNLVHYMGYHSEIITWKSGQFYSVDKRNSLGEKKLLLNYYYCCCSPFLCIRMNFLTHSSTCSISSPEPHSCWDHKWCIKVISQSVQFYIKKHVRINTVLCLEFQCDC